PTGVATGVRPPVTLAAPADLTAATNPYSVAVGDLNGDGKPDLAVVVDYISRDTNEVAVLLNTTAPGASTPTFAAKQEFTTGSVPESVAIGDFNGDGLPALA